MKKFPRASSVPDFCNRFDMALSTYYRKVPLGQVPPFRKIGRRSVILSTDEERWLQALEEGQIGETVDVSSMNEARLTKRRTSSDAA